MDPNWLIAFGTLVLAAIAYAEYRDRRKPKR
jgi:hypothetical protein